MIPRVLWAQRKDIVYITFEVFEVKDEKIEINDNVIKFYGVRGSDGAKFAVSLELFGAIDAGKSKFNVGQREVSLILAKADTDAPYWPRLIKSTQKMHYIHTDFSKWIDEDEEDEMHEDPGMGNFGNFDLSQFGGAGSNFDMGAFGNSGDFEDDEDVSEEGSKHECGDDNCSHDANDEVKISGLTKDNGSFSS